MSVESLPWTLLLLLAQFTVGVAALVYYVQMRGIFEGGFLRVCSWMTVTGALLLTLTALVIDPVSTVDSYALDSDLLQPVRLVSLAMTLFSIVRALRLGRSSWGSTSGLSIGRIPYQCRQAGLMATTSDLPH